MEQIKQANQVRGNKIGCINYQMCTVCYGCRGYDERDLECVLCMIEGEDPKRNFNVCNTKLHESWKLNKMATKIPIGLPSGSKWAVTN